MRERTEAMYGINGRALDAATNHPGAGIAPPRPVGGGPAALA